MISFCECTFGVSLRVNKIVPSNVPPKFMLKNLFQGYLKSLGMARTAEVKRDARIGEGIFPIIKFQISNTYIA